MCGLLLQRSQSPQCPNYTKKGIVRKYDANAAETIYLDYLVQHGDNPGRNGGGHTRGKNARGHAGRQDGRGHECGRGGHDSANHTIDHTSKEESTPDDMWACHVIAFNTAQQNYYIV